MSLANLGARLTLVGGGIAVVPGGTTALFDKTAGTIVALVGGAMALVGGVITHVANGRKAAQDVTREAEKTARDAENQRLLQETARLTKELTAHATGGGGYVWFMVQQHGSWFQLVGQVEGKYPLFDLRAVLEDLDERNRMFREAQERGMSVNVEQILATTQTVFELASVPTMGLGSAPNESVSFGVPAFRWDLSKRSVFSFNLTIWTRFGPVYEEVRITSAKAPPVPIDPDTGEPAFTRNSSYQLKVTLTVTRNGEVLQQRNVDNTGSDDAVMKMLAAHKASKN